jgi:phosphatidylinositol kinase/protein kinase (PI-3  family)
MFKCNDDIKREHLILQIFTIFNNFWILAGLNLRLNIYRVLSTGNKMGFIEAVDEA